MIYDPFERFFSTIAIIVLIFSSFLYIYQGHSKEILYEKILMYGFGTFWVSVSILKIYFFFIDYILKGTYTGEIDYIIQSYNVISYIMLYFYLYLYSYILINIIILVVIFIWFSIRSEKEFQAISSLVTIGFTMVLIGWVFEMIPVKELHLIYPSIPPIFIIIGTLTASFPLIINVDFFSKSLANWLVIILISGILLYVILIVFTNLPLLIISQIIIWTSSIVLIIVVIYIIIQISKKTDRSSEPTPSIAKGELKDTIKILTKPATITIEEIQMYREKGLCLVCKGKIERLNYACPKCNALYCFKCSEVLAKLENKCWVCETPFKELQKN